VSGHADPSARVFDSALVAYFKLLSMAAQACGTPESTALLPGIIASRLFRHKSPVPMRWSFSAPSGCWRRRRCVGTGRPQIGAIAATRRCRASKHPPAPAEADDESRDDADGGALQEPRQRFSLVPSRMFALKPSSQFGEEGFLPSGHGATKS